MRWLILVVAISGCWGWDCDPDAWLHQLAGPGAIACGQVDPFRPNSPSPADVRGCMQAALAERAAFWASIDQGVADGREMVGFAYAGGDTAPIQIGFGGSIGMGLGPDTDDYHASVCASLAIGPPCTTMYADLCMICDAPMALPGTISRSGTTSATSCPAPN